MSQRSDREIAARAIYLKRPFRTAMTRSPMDDFLAVSRVFDFEDAPACYTAECYELADAVLAALTFSGRRRSRQLPKGGTR